MIPSFIYVPMAKQHPITRYAKQYNDAREQIKLLENRKNRLKSRLKGLLKDNGADTSGSSSITVVAEEGEYSCKNSISTKFHLREDWQEFLLENIGRKLLKQVIEEIPTLNENVLADLVEKGYVKESVMDALYKETTSERLTVTFRNE